MNETISGNDNGELMGFAGRATSRVRWLIDAYVTIKVAGNTIRTAQKWWVNRTTYQVSVTDRDDVYHDLHVWLLSQMPTETRRAMEAQTQRRTRSGRTFDDEVSPEGMTRSEAELHLIYDGRQTQELKLRGHAVKVWIDQSSPSGGESKFSPERLNFSMRSVEARDAVLELIKEIATKQTKRGPRVYIMTSWGNWMQLRELPPRPWESVILADGVKEMLLADLEQFFEQEMEYVKMGAPYHRGYLLHGPPGTGKTSTIRAIAAKLGLDVYYVPLSDIKLDGDLLQTVSQLPPRAVLLLEDVDVVHATKSRDDAESGGISLSALLNSLDGALTPHGLVTFMTTNSIEALDPALIRPGRADVVQELSLLTKVHAEQLIAGLTGEKVRIDANPFFPVPAADVVEVLKQHLRDPWKGARAAARKLNRKV